MELYGDWRSHVLEHELPEGGATRRLGSSNGAQFPVIDLLLVAVIVAFFLLAALLVRACATVTAQSTDFEPEAENDEPESETAR
jgi:hypothetical protein